MSESCVITTVMIRIEDGHGKTWEHDFDLEYVKTDRGPLNAAQ
jgi:hypothetical protein